MRNLIFVSLCFIFNSISAQQVYYSNTRNIYSEKGSQVFYPTTKNLYTGNGTQIYYPTTGKIYDEHGKQIYDPLTGYIYGKNKIIISNEIYLIVRYDGSFIMLYETKGGVIVPLLEMKKNTVKYLPFTACL